MLMSLALFMQRYSFVEIMFLDKFKYYFDLREMAVKYGIKFPVSLLTHDRAIKLEASSSLRTPDKVSGPKTSYDVPKHRKCFSLDFNSNANVGRSPWVIS